MSNLSYIDVSRNYDIYVRLVFKDISGKDLVLQNISGKGILIKPHIISSWQYFEKEFHNRKYGEIQATLF